jgi:hypothetical protein
MAAAARVGLPARLGELHVEVARAVDAEMATGCVRDGPGQPPEQPLRLVRGHRDREARSRSRNPPQLPQQRTVVPGVLRRLRAEERVEGPVREGQPPAVGLEPLHGAAVLVYGGVLADEETAVAEPQPGEVTRDRGDREADRCQLVAAGAAAEVEEKRTRGLLG